GRRPAGPVLRARRPDAARGGAVGACWIVLVGLVERQRGSRAGAAPPGTGAAAGAQVDRAPEPRAATTGRADGLRRGGREPTRRPQAAGRLARLPRPGALARGRPERHLR